MEHKVFKKQLPGGSPEEIYAASSSACICSMAFEDQRLYWAQNGVIHSVIPSHPTPPMTYQNKPAFQAQNGIGIIGTTAYWTGIDEVYRCPQGGSQSTVIDLGPNNLQLKGLVVVKP